MLVVTRDRAEARACVDAARELTRADYYLACAATLLERTARTEWGRRADKLMAECVELREAIAAEFGR